MSTVNSQMVDDFVKTYNRWPRYHFYPNGNYVSCNQYWAVGLECAICGEHALKEGDQDE